MPHNYNNDPSFPDSNCSIYIHTVCIICNTLSNTAGKIIITNQNQAVIDTTET